MFDFISILNVQSTLLALQVWSTECSLIIGVASNVRSHDITTTTPVWVLAKNIDIVAGYYNQS